MIDANGTIFTMFNNLTVYVFGNDVLTYIVLTVFLTLFAILIQIPLPFAIALNIPLIIILSAFGLVPTYMALIWSMIYLIIAAVAFVRQYT